MKLLKKCGETMDVYCQNTFFMKDFRNGNLKDYINITGLEYLNEIKNKNIPVVFVSGHFNNFELMAMQIEKNGIELGAIYRPLNNFFLNSTMENIKKKFYMQKTNQKRIIRNKRNFKFIQKKYIYSFND